MPQAGPSAAALLCHMGAPTPQPVLVSSPGELLCQQDSHFLSASAGSRVAAGSPVTSRCVRGCGGGQCFPRWDRTGSKSRCCIWPWAGPRCVLAQTRRAAFPLVAGPSPGAVGTPCVGSAWQRFTVCVRGKAGTAAWGCLCLIPLFFISHSHLSLEPYSSSCLLTLSPLCLPSPASLRPHDCRSLWKPCLPAGAAPAALLLSPVGAARSAAPGALQEAINPQQKAQVASLCSLKKLPSENTAGAPLAQMARAHLPPCCSVLPSTAMSAAESKLTSD